MTEQIVTDFTCGNLTIMNIMNISLAILYHHTMHAAASTCIGNHCCIISSLPINLRFFIDKMSAQVVITIRRPIVFTSRYEL